MSNQLSNFSFGDLFWIRIQEHQINFGYKGLPHNVHFTLSYNSESPFVNIHLTKNAKGAQENEKPRFDIAKISKEDLKVVEKHITAILFNVTFERFDFKAFKKKNGKVAFFPHNVPGYTGTALKNNLFDRFKMISKTKGKKLKIEYSDAEELLSDFCSSKEMHDFLINNMADTPKRFKGQGSGILITKKEAIQIIYSETKCFKMRENINPMDFLQQLVGTELANNLQILTLRYLEYLKTANHIDETKPYNYPIILRIPRSQ